MFNKDIREAVKGRGLHLWQLAEMLGVTDATLSRRLRHELPSDEKEHILYLLDNFDKRRQTK